MSVDRGRWVESLRWLVYADRDIRAADLMVSATDPLLHEAAFHCQQAAEKMAKALLILYCGTFPKLHDLEELTALLAEANPDAGRAVYGLAKLTEWYFGTRYPDMEVDFIPSENDVRSAISQLRHLREHIKTLEPKL